jgi:hypothetical protein
VGAVVFYAAFLYVFSPMNLLVIGWFADFEDAISHRVHEVSIGALFTLGFVGVLAQLRKSERSTGAVQAVVALSVAAGVITTSTGFEPLVLAYLLPPIGLIVIDPEWRQVVTPKLQRDLRLLVFAALLLVILGPDVAANFQKATLQVQEHESHWGAMAAFVVAVTLLAFVAAMRPPRWRLAAWSSIAAVTVSAAVSLAFRYDASALGVSHSIATLLWAAGFGITVAIVGASHPDRVPVRKRGEGLVAGVATAVARSRGWKVGWVRTAFAIPVLGGATYGVLWLALPAEGAAGRSRGRRWLLGLFLVVAILTLVTGAGRWMLATSIFVLALGGAIAITLRPLVALVAGRLKFRRVVARMAAGIGLGAALMAVAVVWVLDDVNPPDVPHRIESSRSSTAPVPCGPWGSPRGAGVARHLRAFRWRAVRQLPLITPPFAPARSVVVATAPAAGDAMNRLHWLGRVSAIPAAAATLVIGTAAFVAHFAAETQSLIVDQGPLSLQPTVAGELELFFDSALVRNGQVAVHFLGVLVFWSIGLLILLRARHAPMRVTTSLTLLLLGTALFAPLSALEGAWAEAGSFIGTLRPGPVLWRSAAGVALLLFALIFPDGHPLGRVWSWVVGGFVLHVALFALFPGSWLDPREWGAVAGTVWTLVPALAAVAALIVRFTRIPEEGRPQIRLVVVAPGATIATIVAFWPAAPARVGTVDLCSPPSG